jgi:MoaA/NifB/PqqE/SkfB family radical SAM enzyme
MVGYIVMSISLIAFMGLVVYFTITNDDCPYKWDIDMCRDCGMANKCGGKLRSNSMEE